jgi:Rieske Fe-S protein
MSQQNGMRITRRMLLSIAAGAAIGAILAACSSSGESAAVGAKVTVGTVSDIQASLATQKFVRSAEGKVFLLPAAADAAIAVSWRCTHQGCTVHDPDAQKGTITCPCHSSVFDARTGIVTSGPAPRPLDFVPMTITDGNVVIDTGQITKRTTFDASQVTRLV